MSSRLDRSWTVLASHQTIDGRYCVDCFRRLDGSFGFEKFRRDPEGMGRWTPIAYYSERAYDTRDAAPAAATRLVSWFSDTTR